MSTPTIDNRLLYPDSTPEVAEDFNRVMHYIDAGSGEFPFKTVTFDCPAEGPAIAMQIVPTGGRVADPGIYEYDTVEEETQHFFKAVSFFADDEYTEEWDFLTDTVEDDTTLYPEVKEYVIVTFNAGDGTFSDDETTHDEECYVGEPIGSIQEEPTPPEGKVLTGWTYDGTPWDIENDDVEGSMVLDAVYEDEGN